MTVNVTFDVTPVGLSFDEMCKEPGVYAVVSHPNYAHIRFVVEQQGRDPVGFDTLSSRHIFFGSATFYGRMLFRRTADHIRLTIEG